MSIDALNWALKDVRCASSSAKLVLLIYANFANDQGRAYPSNETLTKLSDLNSKTVRAAVALLEEAGHLIDTGERTGRTGQIRVYQVFA